MPSRYVGGYFSALVTSALYPEQDAHNIGTLSNVVPSFDLKQIIITIEGDTEKPGSLDDVSLAVELTTVLAAPPPQIESPGLQSVAPTVTLTTVVQVVDNLEGPAALSNVSPTIVLTVVVQQTDVMETPASLSGVAFNSIVLV